MLGFVCVTDLLLFVQVDDHKVFTIEVVVLEKVLVLGLEPRVLALVNHHQVKVFSLAYVIVDLG